MATEKSEIKNYVYFFYSRNQLSKRNEIDSSIGRRFIPGKVYVDGKQEEFTEILKTAESTNSDAILVTEGYIENIRYIMPKSISYKK